MLAILVHGMLADSVKDPVHLGSPAAMVSVVHLLHEVVQGFLLGLVQGQGLPDVGDVIEWLQLGHPRAQHHREEVDEEVGVLSDRQVRFVTHFLEPEGQKENVTQGVEEINVGTEKTDQWGQVGNSATKRRWKLNLMP